MVLISVQSVETNNGYQFKNDFAESIIIDPKSRVSLINANLSRNIDYVILDGGNEFEMVVGGANNPKDVIGIPSGTYDANGLAQEIESALNGHYANSGHSFNVNYMKKQNTFNLQHIFRTNTLTTNECVDWVIGATTQAPNITLIKRPIELKLNGLTNGTAEYAVSTNAIIATQNVPDFVDGGSVFQLKPHFTGSFPQAGGAGSSFGWGFGMYSKQQGTPPTTGVKQVSANANLDWLDIGIVFYKEETGETQFKIIENGVNIYGGTASRGFTPRNGDEYKIVLSQSSTNDGRPRYQYKRHGQTDFTDFPIGAGLQTIRTEDWRNQELYSVVFSDTEGTNGNAVLRELNYSAKGSNELVASGITALQNGHNFADNKLVRTNYNNGVEGGGDNQGILTQLIGADQTSMLQFDLPSASNKLFAIALIDEEARLYNADTDALRTGGDTLYGTTSQANGTKALSGNLNPSFGSVLFRTDTNKIYRRNALNKHCSYEPLSGGSPDAIIAPPLVEITAERDFTTAKWTTTTKFYAMCVGNDSAMRLTASPSGDREKNNDELLVAIINNPESDFTGIQTATITAQGSGYTNSTEFTCRLGDLTGGGGTAGVGAIVKYTTNGGGQFDNGAGSNDLCSGKGYALNQIYKIIPIDPTTGADLTGTDAGNADATITITELTLPTDKFNEEMGSAYDADKTNNGYRWLAQVRDWEGGATADQTTINGFALSVEESTEHTPYAEFYPQYEANFGNILGFPQAQYILAGTEILEAPDHPLPDLALPLNPSLHINIPNLPIKSYVGMKLKKDALLGDKPVGNIQGLTKQVAKIPRFHDKSLVSSSGLEGPFYYDYFPYDVPLHNATELVLNELDIEITNPDGTLAKDIGSAHLLLNITNVESVGEGGNSGGIGMPIKRPQSKQQLNNNPAMLQPSIYGGKSYGDNVDGKLMTATHGTPI